MIKELKLNPSKIKDINKNDIIPDDNQFKIGNKYELTNPYLSQYPMYIWYQTKDENGNDFYIPDWCFDDITEKTISDEELEIQRLELELKRKMDSLRKNKEKFFSSNLYNKNGKFSIIKRIIKETYQVNDYAVNLEKDMTSGIDFGSFFGPDKASTSTYYIWMDEVIEWFEKNLDKYGDRILVSDRPVFKFDWSKEKIFYTTEEENLIDRRNKNHDLFIDTIRRCNSDGPLDEEKPKIVTEMRLDEMRFGFRYDHKDDKYNFEAYKINDVTKEFIHQQLTNYFDKLLSNSKFIIIGNIWCYSSKEFRNYNPTLAESLYNIHLRIRQVTQEEIDRRLLVCK